MLFIEEQKSLFIEELVHLHLPGFRFFGLFFDRKQFLARGEQRDDISLEVMLLNRLVGTTDIKGNHFFPEYTDEAFDRIHEFSNVGNGHVR